MARVMTAAEISQQERFYTAWARIDALNDFGLSRADLVPDIDGLSTDARGLLYSEDGREMIRDWAEAFDETIVLLHDLASEGRRRRRLPPQAYEAATDAAERALKAFVRRINLLSRRQVS